MERAFVLPVVIICVGLLPIVALAFYAMHRSKPSRLKLSANLLKLASFSIEVESNDHRKELTTGSSGTDSASQAAPDVSEGR